MARVEIAETVITTNGAAVPGVSVQVNERDAGAATVYESSTGATTVSNPLTTGVGGRIEGWLEEGSYDLVVSGPGIGSYTQRYEALAGDGPGVAMEVWRDTHQSIANNTLTDITWEAGAANSDLGESFWAEASPTLITFQRPGMYSVSASIDFASNATGYRYVNILKANYDGIVSAGSETRVAVSGEKTRVHIATHLKVTDVGQQIKLQVKQTSGGALDVESDFDADGFTPVLMVARLGAAYDRVFGY